MKSKTAFTFIFLTFLLFLVPTVRAEAQNTDQETRKAEMMLKVQEKQTALRERIASKQADLMEKLDMKRKEASESFKLKHDAFKLRIEAIRDEKKKMLTERISSRSAQINIRRTNHWTEVLNKLSGILQRLEDKVNAAKTAGKDTGSAEAAIASAEAKIAEAQEAVLAQAGNVYTASITSDATLNSTVGTMVKQLQSDLQSVHKLVIEAKQAVMNVVREMARAHLVPLKVGQPGALTPTVSATGSPTLTATPSATIEPTEEPSATPTP